jgi:hypothetical protein
MIQGTLILVALFALIALIRFEAILTIRLARDIHTWWSGW